MAKKKATAAKATKLSAVKEPFTKSELLTSIAETTGLTRKDVSNVIDELTNAIERHVKPRGPGEFKMPGLLKIKTIRKKATKARKGINPFTGEETVFKAKPARTVVKVVPLKKLKEMVQ
jgi:nucleoid DNA-binding protein